MMPRVKRFFYLQPLRQSWTWCCIVANACVYHDPLASA